MLRLGWNWPGHTLLRLQRAPLSFIYLVYSTLGTKYLHSSRYKQCKCTYITILCPCFHFLLPGQFSSLSLFSVPSLRRGQRRSRQTPPEMGEIWPYFSWDRALKDDELKTFEKSIYRDACVFLPKYNVENRDCRVFPIIKACLFAKTVENRWLSSPMSFCQNSWIQDNPELFC